MASFIYGKHVVNEFLDKFPSKASKLWYSSEDVLKSIKHSILCPVEEMSARDLSRKFALKEYESHQGLILELKASLEDILITPLEELLINCSDNGKALIWLPEIQDAHNLGAIIRSAVALGNIGGIIIPGSRSVRLSTTVAKVSVGSIFSCQFAFSANLKNSAQLIRSSGFRLIGLQKIPEARSIALTKFAEIMPFALIIGSEEIGIPKQIQPLLDLSCYIPQSELIDSLNMSVATGITLYEVQKQLSS